MYAGRGTRATGKSGKGNSRKNWEPLTEGSGAQYPMYYIYIVLNKKAIIKKQTKNPPLL